MNMFSDTDIYQFEGCRILIIDDEDFNHELVSFFLREIGIDKIFSAYDGIEGMEMIAKINPDLVILDISMPRLDGLEMLRTLRQIPRYANLPMIIQTGNDTGESRNIMFNAGATDYVTKPLIIHEFQGRVKTHLKNLLLVNSLEKQLDTIAQEMQAAAELQRSMLPPVEIYQSIAQQFGINVYSRFEPSSALGGDFFGIYPLTSSAFSLYMCDFAGHGVGAALNTARLHTMVQRLPPPTPNDPAAYLARLNQELHQTLSNRHYATFFLGIIDVVEHSITYAAAGGPNPAQIQEGQCQWLDGRGMPLGLFNKAQYTNHTARFAPGSKLFLYSDAFVETAWSDGAVLAPDKVARFLNQAIAQHPPHQVLDALIDTFINSAASPLEDDLTALFLDWAS